MSRRAVSAIGCAAAAQRGHVDRTPHVATSAIKLVTSRFGLEPLPGARGGLTAAFGF